MKAELAAVPTTDAEQPGVGKAFGGLLGGALAAAGGMHLGAAAASLMVPGVGPVLALGTAAAVLAGAGGAAGGAALGDYLDESATNGLPTDELYLYKDALRKGRSVLVVPVDSEQQADEVGAILSASGAESLDAARESWWIGLRDAEEAEYTGAEDFSSLESSYRLGFEVAQHGQFLAKRLKMPVRIFANAIPKSSASNRHSDWDTNAASGTPKSCRNGIHRLRHSEETCDAEKTDQAKPFRFWRERVPDRSSRTFEIRDRPWLYLCCGRSCVPTAGNVDRARQAAKDARRNCVSLRSKWPIRNGATTNGAEPLKGSRISSRC